jgi:hypothetical protein
MYPPRVVVGKMGAAGLQDILMEKMVKLILTTQQKIL